MRVLPDSNVLIAALVWPDGVCARLIEHILARPEIHELLISEFVFAETERILAERFQVENSLIAEFARMLRKGGMPVPHDPARSTVSFAVRDPDDAWVLAATVRSGTEFLVTGDKDLLELGNGVPGLIVVTPRSLLDQLQLADAADPPQPRHGNIEKVIPC